MVGLREAVAETRRKPEAVIESPGETLLPLLSSYLGGWEAPVCCCQDTA
jgi:hypothetical protein